ncbi:MAG: hypothetical protein LBS37_06585 [Treponema sp.]|nr:hypothetical protein [Treponema sp.]
MCPQTVKKVIGALILMSLFCACGDLDIVLPSAGTYQVKAQAGGVSLDDRSLINADDTIRPYFARSVTNDPDITGLMVFLKDSGGNSLEGKVLYTLKSDANDGFEIFGEKAKDEQEADASTGEPVDEPVPLPRIAGANIQIPVKRLDRDMPVFLMPENLEIGQYTMVFQVLGEKETLYQTEQSVYYLGDAAFSLKDVQMYLPGVSAGSRLVSPGVTVMLEARLDYDSRLDPYIVWYNGKKIIGEGNLSGGAGSFLWKAPDQTGFHLLRAEAFPFESRKGIAGSSREISIPVSPKAVDENLVSGDIPELLHWYQFGGNLQDSKPPVSAAWSLISQTEKAPRWSPAGYSYGLLTGPNEVYLLPPLSFLRDNGSEDGGQFLLRFKPISNGSIFNAQFTTRASLPAGLEMDLSLNGENLTLRLTASETSTVELSAPVVFTSDEYITAAIDFLILPNRFEAVLNPIYSAEAEQQAILLDNNPKVQIRKTVIGLDVPLSGDCNLALGTGGGSAGAAAIWDEFAILHLSPGLFAKGPAVSAVIISSGEEKEKDASL